VASDTQQRYKTHRVHFVCSQFSLKIINLTDKGNLYQLSLSAESNLEDRLVKTTLVVQRRVAKLERPFAKHSDNAPPAGGYWFDYGGGVVHQGGAGRWMTREALKATFPDARIIRLKIFDKELPNRHEHGGDNANSGTERSKKGVS
jgi:hypothetical protein